MKHTVLYLYITACLLHAHAKKFGWNTVGRYLPWIYTCVDNTEKWTGMIIFLHVYAWIWHSCLAITDFSLDPNNSIRNGLGCVFFFPQLCCTLDWNNQSFFPWKGMKASTSRTSYYASNGGIPAAQSSIMILSTPAQTIESSTSPSTPPLTIHQVPEISS